MVAPQVRLVPFSRAYLPAVLPWFDHPEVQHRLGGRDWPERELALRIAGPHEEFRGRRVLRGQTFVAVDADGHVVGQIGGDVYDRWTVWDPGTERVTAVDPRRTMGSAYVVDPARWRQGYGRATLIALLGAPETADVEQFVLGIDADNAVSLRAAASAGFVPRSTDPDAEGMVFVSAVR